MSSTPSGTNTFVPGNGKRNCERKKKDQLAHFVTTKPNKKKK